MKEYENKNLMKSVLEQYTLKKSKEANPSELVVWSDGEFRPASFDMDDLLERRLQVVGNFNDCLDVSDKSVEGIQLIGTAALQPRTYTVISNDYLSTSSIRSQVAYIYNQILAQARELAQAQGVPYFGVIAVAEHPEKPVQINEQKLEALFIEGIEESKLAFGSNKENYFSKNEIFKKGENEEKPLVPERKETWVLHPTVQLYVKR